jgi:hypothetical protein
MALVPFGLDHESSRHYGKPYGSTWTERKRIDHLLGNCQQDRAANSPKSCYVPHGIDLQERY